VIEEDRSREGGDIVTTHKNPGPGQYQTPETLSAAFREQGLVCDPGLFWELADLGWIPSYIVDGRGPYFRPPEVHDFLRVNLSPIKPAADSKRPQTIPECLVPLLDSLYELPLDHFRQRECIYFLLRGAEVVYVGRTRCLPKCIITHLNEKKEMFDRVVYLPFSEFNLVNAESYFIQSIKPFLNVMGTRTAKKRQTETERAHRADRVHFSLTGCIARRKKERALQKRHWEKTHWSHD
jgi:hypothetical protein